MAAATSCSRAVSAASWRRARSWRAARPGRWPPVRSGRGRWRVTARRRRLPCSSVPARSTVDSPATPWAALSAASAAHRSCRHRRAWLRPARRPRRRSSLQVRRDGVQDAQPHHHQQLVPVRWTDFLPDATRATARESRRHCREVPVALDTCRRPHLGGTPLGSGDQPDRALCAACCQG